MKRLEHLLYKRVLRDLGLFSNKVKRLVWGVGLVSLYKYLRRGTKEMKSDFSQWSSVTGPQAIGTN